MIAGLKYLFTSIQNLGSSFVQGTVIGYLTNSNFNGFCRNQDFQEVTVEVNSEPVLKFALAYGFRNIQNIVQKIKRKKLSYHFVEVMACPSGNSIGILISCINRSTGCSRNQYSQLRLIPHQIIC